MSFVFNKADISTDINLIPKYFTDIEEIVKMANKELAKYHWPLLKVYSYHVNNKPINSIVYITIPEARNCYKVFGDYSKFIYYVYEIFKILYKINPKFLSLCKLNYQNQHQEFIFSEVKEYTLLLRNRDNLFFDHIELEYISDDYTAYIPRQWNIHALLSFLKVINYNLYELGGTSYSIPGSINWFNNIREILGIDNLSMYTKHEIFTIIHTIAQNPDDFDLIDVTKDTLYLLNKELNYYLPQNNHCFFNVKPIDKQNLLEYCRYASNHIQALEPVDNYLIAL